MQSMALTGKTAIITGGASGIGFEITKLLLQDGAKCIIWDKDREQGEKAYKHLTKHGTVMFYQLDILDNSAISESLDETVPLFGYPNVLVNSAGIIGKKGKLWELRPEDWISVVNVNLVGCFNVCYHVIPLMLNTNYGRIVNVSSVSGKDGSIYASHYSSAKAGIIALSKSLAKELAPYNILVNCVTPSATNTPMYKGESSEDQIRQISKVPLGRIAESEEVARMIEWLCSPYCTFSTGAVFDVSGGRSTY